MRYQAEDLKQSQKFSVAYIIKLWKSLACDIIDRKVINRLKNESEILKRKIY